jgi:hypothetical protein
MSVNTIGHIFRALPVYNSWRILAKLKTEGKPSIEIPEELVRRDCAARYSADHSSANRTGIANKILEAKGKERSKDLKEKEIARMTFLGGSRDCILFFR